METQSSDWSSGSELPEMEVQINSSSPLKPSIMPPVKCTASSLKSMALQSL